MHKPRAGLVVLLVLCLLALVGCNHGTKGTGSAPTEKTAAVTFFLGDQKTTVANGQSLNVRDGVFSIGVQLESGGSAANLEPFVDSNMSFSTGNEARDGVLMAVFTWGSGAHGQVITARIRKGAPLGDNCVTPGDFSLTFTRYSAPVQSGPTLISVTVDDEPRPWKPEEGARIYFLGAGSHSFDVTFDRAMDRLSVQRALLSGLAPDGPQSVSFDWESDRSLRIDAALSPVSLYQRYAVSLDGATDRDGIALSLGATINVVVGSESSVVAVPLPVGSGGDTRLAGIAAGQTVDAISPDGLNIIALEPVSPWNPDGMMRVPAQHPWLYRQEQEPTDLAPILGEVADVSLGDGGLWGEPSDGRPALLGTSLDLLTPRRVDWNTGWLLGYAVSGDGKTVAWFTPDAQGDAETDVVNLNVYRTGTGEITVFRGIVRETLPYGTEVMMPLSTAMDLTGTKLVYTSWYDKDSADLTAIDLISGKVLSRTELGAWGLQCVLSADGTHAAGAGWTVDLTTGKARRYSEPDPVAPLISPDGKYIAYSVVEDGGVDDSGPTLIKLVEVDTGKWWLLGEGYPVGFSGDGSQLFVVRKAK